MTKLGAVDLKSIHERLQHPHPMSGDLLLPNSDRALNNSGEVERWPVGLLSGLTHGGIVLDKNKSHKSCLCTYTGTRVPHDTQRLVAKFADCIVYDADASVCLNTVPTA
jgi:hypothetical protein